MKKTLKLKGKLSLQKNVIASLVTDPQMGKIFGGDSTNCNPTGSAVPISVVVACTTIRTVTATNTSTIDRE